MRATIKWCLPGFPSSFLYESYHHCQHTRNNWPKDLVTKTHQKEASICHLTVCLTPFDLNSERTYILPPLYVDFALTKLLWLHWFPQLILGEAVENFRLRLPTATVPIPGEIFLFLFQSNHLWSCHFQFLYYGFHLCNHTKHLLKHNREL